MHARLNGPFGVFDEDGRDVTPAGMKERGLLALLLASPGQRRTRIWLQNLLWSDRRPQQALGILRQALANLRKALGRGAERLQADRTTLWIAPQVRVDALVQGEFLGDLDSRDPEFSDWLRDQRSREEASAATGPAAIRASGAVRVQTGLRPAVAFGLNDLGVSPRGRFLTRAIGQRSAGDLILFGDIDVIHSDGGLDLVNMPAIRVPVEMECHGGDGEDLLLIRVIVMPARRIVWTGRMALGLKVPDIRDSPEAARCVNKAVASVIDHLSAGAASSPAAARTRATRLIYDDDRTGLTRADDMLVRLQDGEMRGLAVAWRGFIRLTSALEFRDFGPDSVAEARAFADDALRAMSDHPVVLALASRIRLKVEGDPDQAHHLALRAAEMSDQNPYALEALGPPLVFHGDDQAAHHFAQRARIAAQGLPNGFNWDMQVCLTALGVGQVTVAREAAAERHRKMPFYRPALRHLVALSLLVDDRASVEYDAGQLRRLEPDFEMAMLVQPDCPFETLRVLGYVQTLRERLS